VVTATVNVDRVRSYRGASMSRCNQGALRENYYRITIPVKFCTDGPIAMTFPIVPKFLTPEEEIRFDLLRIRMRRYIYDLVWVQHVGYGIIYDDRVFAVSSCL
jgi:hypothetical protein